MLPYTEHSTGETTLIMMPFLGGSQNEYTQSIAILSKKYRCITVDLPGFGDAVNIPGYTVAEMSDALLELLPTLNLTRYLFVGHSMAGKLSAVVARQLVDGVEGLHPPVGLVLVAPSPPGPEPMTDSKRTQMLDALGENAHSRDPRKEAEKYLRDNSSSHIDETQFETAITDVLRMNRFAWTAWLTEGSKEDWANRVGSLPLPTLLLAGEKDGALGPDIQRKITEVHFPAAHLITVDCNHLIPLEAPDELASLISNFLQVV